MAALRVVTGAFAAAAALFLAAPAAALDAPTVVSPASNASVQSLPAFSWNAVAGAHRYEFALAADAGFNAPVLGAGEGQFFTRNTKATVKKTLPNGTYWWRVRAVSAAGAVSPWTAPRPLRKAWTLAPALVSPTQGAVATHPSTPLVLKWSAVPHAAKYWVTIASDPALGSAVFGQANVETRGTSYAPRALLLPPGTYYWGVTPLDAQGHRGAPSAVGTFTWLWPTTTATNVGDLRADAEVYDPFFSWDPVPGAAKYELEVNPAQDFSPGSKVCCTGPGFPTIIGSSHAPDRLLRDNTYYWRVRSLDAFGNAGDWNVGPSFVKTFDKVPPVTAPSVKNVRMRDNLSDPGSDVDGVTPGYQTHVPVVAWDPVSGASSYEVDVFPFEGGICNWSDDGLDHWHSTTATPAWTPLGHSWNNVKPYADARAMAQDAAFRPFAGKGYCVRVRARADRDIASAEVYGDYTYMNGGTAPAFEWKGPPLGNFCSPSCTTGYLGSDDYLVPATGVTSTRMPLFTWKPLPLFPKKKLFNTSGTLAVTLTGAVAGPTELKVTVQDNLADSSMDDVLIWPDKWGQVEGFTYDDGDLGSLVTAINSEPDLQGVVTAEVHVSGVPLAYVTAAPFTPGTQSYFVLVAKDASFSNVVDYAFTQLPAYAPRGLNSPTTYQDETTLFYWAVLPASAVSGNGAAGNPLLAAAPNFRKESNPPTLTTPTAGENVVGQPTFRWSPAEGARRYTLQVSQDPSFGTTLDEVSTASTAYTANKSYPADTVLYWRVRANDENLVGLRWSAVGSFQRRLPAPAPLFDALAGDMFPVMSWAPVPGAVSYRIAVDEGDGEHFEYDDFRSAAATFVKMTGTGVTGIRVRANFPTNTTMTTPGPWSTTVFHTRTMGEPTGARTEATDDQVLFSWDAKPGTKQYRVLVSSREDFSVVVEDVKTDNPTYAPHLTQAPYLQGGTFWWKVAAFDEDLNLGDFTRPHSFSLKKGPGTVQTTQRLRLSMKGRLKARRVRRLVVTVKAGARPVSGARVRAFGVGVVTKWKKTNATGRVVFRLKPKVRGVVFLQAMKTGYLAGASRVRVR
jgi:hypothetical protein